MSKFKVGDRVSVYGQTDACWCDGYYATVEGVRPSGDLNVLFDDKEAEPRKVIVHRKQCRRLKPKAKLRRVWITTMDIPKDTGIKYHCMVSTWPERHGPGAEWVEFVEVKKGGTS